MKLCLSIAVFTFITLSAIAQNRIVFSSQNYVGLLTGENGSKLQLQTINGIKHKTYFVGIGTGIDWYYQRSIPLFASFNKDFFKKAARNFYIAADGGVNFASSVDKYYNENTTHRYIPALYWATGFGYKIGIGKNNDALLIQAGYSYKHIREKVKSGYVADPSDPYPTEYYDNYLRRVSLKFGLSF